MLDMIRPALQGTPKIWDATDVEISPTYITLQQRHACILHLGYAVPDLTALLLLREFIQGEGLLEVGSGLGLWGALLSQLGVAPLYTTDANIGEVQPFNPTGVMNPPSGGADLWETTKWGPVWDVALVLASIY